MVNLKSLLLTCILLGSFVFLSAQQTNQETITATLPVTMDATIFSEQADGANGQGFLFVGRTNQSNLRRSLVQFDVSSLPLNANILTTTLQITGSKSSIDNVSIHRLTSPWSEGGSGVDVSGGAPQPGSSGDATWSHGTYDTDPWSTAGGDFISIASANGAIAENTVNTLRGEEMVWDIYSWLFGNVPNYGWILIGEETSDKTAVRLNSGESENNSPVLIITYNLPSDDCTADGGLLTGGPLTICVGDDGTDQVVSGDIGLTNAVGGNSRWVVTDLNRNIIVLSNTFEGVNFDGTGSGPSVGTGSGSSVGTGTGSSVSTGSDSRLLWHLSFENGLSGATAGSNANDLAGCYDLSNPIVVNRTDDPAICNGPQCDLQSASLTGGPFSFCVGDGAADQLNSDDIRVNGASDLPSRWVVTDLSRNILGLPEDFTDVNFDGAGVGTCQVWYIQYDGELSGLDPEQNLNDLQGCFSLSNPVTIQRNNDAATCNPCHLNRALLSGGPIEFCVGDGISDVITNGRIGLFNHTTQGRYVVTDINRNILGLPGFYSDVDFEGAGAGTCLIYYVQFESDVSGFNIGANLFDLTGCHSISNSVTVNRRDDARTCGIGTGCQVSGGNLTGGPYSFCVGDGSADRLASDAIVMFNGYGGSRRWVVTDINNNILGLPANFTDVDFDGAGTGTCLIYNLQFDGAISGLQVGQNLNDIIGCSSLSNPVSIVRSTSGEGCGGATGGEETGGGETGGEETGGGETGGGETGGGETCDVDGGTLVGGPFEFCVGNEEADVIKSDDLEISAGTATHTTWVVTDINKDVVAKAASLADIDFDSYAAGTFLLWSVGADSQASLDGLAIGSSVDSVEGCSDSSNPIQITLLENCTVAPVSGCQTPSNITVREINSSTFNISWDRVAGTKHYLLEVGFKGEPESFVTVTARRTQVSISVAWPKVILVRVRTVCTWPPSSAWSEYVELGIKDGSKSSAISNGQFGKQYGAFTVIDDHLSIHPNPASDFIDVSFLSQSRSNVIELINFQGQRIKKLNMTEGTRQRLDLSDLPSGMYMMTLTTDGVVMDQKRFVKTP